LYTTTYSHDLLPLSLHDALPIFGVKRAVTSPTFTIIKEYKGNLPLYHIDAYRLEGSEEDIGFEEYIDGDGVTVIEWAGFIEDFIPQDRLEIMIEYNGETA